MLRYDVRVALGCFAAYWLLPESLLIGVLRVSLVAYGAVALLSVVLSLLSAVQALAPSPSSFALITGASSGIGLAIAHALAARGFHLILVARDRSKLDAAAETVRMQHGVQVLVLVKDLSQRGAALSLHEDVMALQRNSARASASAAGEGEGEGAGAGLHVDILVNNAGVGATRLLLQQRADEIDSMITLMATNATLLCHAFLPSMLRRRRGRILNVSSITAAFPGGPYSLVYAASKSFLLSLSQGLDFEMRKSVHKRYYGKLIADDAPSMAAVASAEAAALAAAAGASGPPVGVSVVTVCPGATTDTSWAATAQSEASLIFQLPGLSQPAELVAARSVSTLLEGSAWSERVVAPDLLAKAVMWTLPKLPTTFTHWVCFALWGTRQELARTLFQP
jgi:short-subunit dehydrogenase